MLAPSLLKVITFLGSWAIIWLPIVFLVNRFINWQPQQSLTPKQKLIFLTSLYPFAPLIIWFVIQVEEISWVDCGLKWQLSLPSSLGMGLVIGVVGVGVIFALESFLGLVNWQWKNLQRLLSLALPILIVGLGVAFIEELVFRGFIIYELTSDYSYLTAAIISSAIFAVLHLVWERQETAPQLPGLWLMGMVLAGARLIDNGSIGLAWGLHAGWIWGLSCLDSAELLTYTAKEVTWISGMNRQPLAGLAGILCLVGTGLFLWLLSINSIV
ncbi:CPBP family intramembrane metalloprotease [Pleurocapsales cyanobacterium LEGE 06147]|nr:CPBP family intramembrane metalloprotease [Pleurocapsales cyanobacterium LEGE 06147]